MTTHVNTVIVGGGQAGLAVSYFLTLHGRDHLVIEQARPCRCLAESSLGQLHAQHTQLAVAAPGSVASG